MFSIQLKNVACHCGGTNLVLPVAHRLDRRLRQRLGVHVPLIGQKRLDDRARAVAVRHGVNRRFNFVDEALRFQHFNNGLAGFYRRNTVQRHQHRLGMSVAEEVVVTFEERRASSSNTLIEGSRAAGRPRNR